MGRAGGAGGNIGGVCPHERGPPHTRLLDMLKIMLGNFSACKSGDPLLNDFTETILLEGWDFKSCALKESIAYSCVL